MYSRLNYNSVAVDGVNKNFAVPFEVDLQLSEIKVALEGVDVVGGWTYDESPNQITFDTAPTLVDPLEGTLLIYRETDIDARAVVFTNSSINNERYMNKADKQLFYKMQELWDVKDESNETLQEMVDSIEDLTATKVEEIVGITLEGFQDLVTEATLSRDSSATSATSALGSAILAENAKTSAELAEVNINNVINNANINSVNLQLGSRTEGTATLTYGSRI